MTDRTSRREYRRIKTREDDEEESDWSCWGTLFAICAVIAVLGGGIYLLYWILHTYTSTFTKSSASNGTVVNNTLPPTAILSLSTMTIEELSVIFNQPTLLLSYSMWVADLSQSSFFNITSSVLDEIGGTVTYNLNSTHTLVVYRNGSIVYDGTPYTITITTNSQSSPPAHQRRILSTSSSSPTIITIRGLPFDVTDVSSLSPDNTTNYFFLELNPNVSLTTKQTENNAVHCTLDHCLTHCSGAQELINECVPTDFAIQRPDDQTCAYLSPDANGTQTDLLQLYQCSFDENNIQLIQCSKFCPFACELYVNNGTDFIALNVQEQLCYSEICNYRMNQIDQVPFTGPTNWSVFYRCALPKDAACQIVPVDTVTQDGEPKNNLQCNCQSGFTNTQNNSLINDTANTLVCEDIDECLQVKYAVNCLPSLHCINTQGSFLCGCYNGEEVVTPSSGYPYCGDINECALVPTICGPNGTCENSVGSYTCLCHTGFTLNSAGLSAVDANGTLLNSSINACVDINECLVNQTICNTQNSQCHNTVGSYLCTCAPGYFSEGELCTSICVDGFIWNNTICADIDECLLTVQVGNVHLPRCIDPLANCTNTIGSFNCTCPQGFEYIENDKHCSNINECVNNQPCASNSGAICIDLVPGVECLCSPTQVYDFASQTCVCAPGYESDNANCLFCGTVSNPYCVDTDECDLYPPVCDLRMSECVNTIGSYFCNCSSGFKYDPLVANNNKTCVDIDECQSPLTNECSLSNFTVCNNLFGSYECRCMPSQGLKLNEDGISCHDSDECTNIHTCSSYGVAAVCFNTFGSFYCSCQHGFEINGTKCVPFPDCTVEGCALNAACVITQANTTITTTCYCNSGFIGDGYSLCTPTSGVCTTSPCGTNAICTPHPEISPESYSCSCPPGFSNLDPYVNPCTDIDECSNKNVGSVVRNLCPFLDESTTCTNIVGGYHCDCPPFYARQITDHNLQLLLQQVFCSPPANCTPIIQDFFGPTLFSEAQCMPHNPCDDGNVCDPVSQNCGFTIDPINGPTVSCTCKNGFIEYRKGKCVDINECEQMNSSPFCDDVVLPNYLNNISDGNYYAQYCINTPGSFYCSDFITVFTSVSNVSGTFAHKLSNTYQAMQNADRICANDLETWNALLVNSFDGGFQQSGTQGNIFGLPTFFNDTTTTAWISAFYQSNFLTPFVRWPNFIDSSKPIIALDGTLIAINMSMLMSQGPIESKYSELAQEVLFSNLEERVIAEISSYSSGFGGGKSSGSSSYAFSAYEYDLDFQVLEIAEHNFDRVVTYPRIWTNIKPNNGLLEPIDSTSLGDCAGWGSSNHGSLSISGATGLLMFGTIDDTNQYWSHARSYIDCKASAHLLCFTDSLSYSVPAPNIAVPT